MNLYVVRHGETTWNKEHRVQGITDMPLTEKGIEDTKELIPLIKKLNIDIVISSPLKRAKDTAKILVESKLPINTDDRITDIDNEAYQVLYKSLKGSTILINDEDGKESIKIIDAAGQQIIMENNDLVALSRRGKETNPPETASISIITNRKFKFKK